jgi:hypothetical protein
LFREETLSGESTNTQFAKSAADDRLPPKPMTNSHIPVLIHSLAIAIALPVHVMPSVELPPNA